MLFFWPLTTKAPNLAVVDPSTHALLAPDHPDCSYGGGYAVACLLIFGFEWKPICEWLMSQLLPVEWFTGPPPLLLNKAAYRSGYAFSRATHRSRKWSLSLFISIFKRWSTFSALDEQFWSSSNLSSWLKVPETISSSITRSASVMDSSKFWWHWSSNSLCFGSIAIRCSSVASQLTQTAKWM